MLARSLEKGFCQHYVSPLPFSNLSTSSVMRTHKTKAEMVRRKVVIITATLVLESWEKTDEELEADITKSLSPTHIPWVAQLEKVTVLS